MSPRRADAAAPWDPDGALPLLAESAPEGLARLIHDHGAAIDRAIRALGSTPGPSRTEVLAAAVAACGRGEGPVAELRTYLLGLVFGSAAPPPSSATDEAVRVHLEERSPAQRSLLWFAHVEHDPGALRAARVATADLQTALADGLGAPLPTRQLGPAIARSAFGEPGAAYARRTLVERARAALWPAGGPVGLEWAGLALLVLGILALVGAVAGAVAMVIGALGP
ncbi:MAG: hypothetical protein KDB04_01630 [Acidimicrobiales bacterium]|nr:hypothetical protein [Acidimicrobiales bacterium]